jgi:hypothetical protein
MHITTAAFQNPKPLFIFDCLQAASMLPEYLTPTNGGVMSPRQLLLHITMAAFKTLNAC